MTANKALVAAHGPELSALAARRGTSLRYEASALAGVPFLGALAARPLVSDVDRFAAVMNGTSNFILSTLDAGRCSFDDALGQARRLGYTEPDPSRDVDGLDAADQLLLLATLFGWGTAPSAALGAPRGAPLEVQRDSLHVSYGYVPRFFVTGATGFLGGELVKQLVGRGHQVAALVRAPEKATLLKALGVELYAGDITNRESLRVPMQGADGVFHAAAWYKVGVKGHGDVPERVNIQGTRNVLEMARELAVPKVVYTSTVGVFGDTRGRLVDETYYARGPFLTEYDRTKWMAHYEVALPLLQSGMPLVIVMPGLIYGPGDTSAVRSALVQLLKGRLAITPKGVSFSWGYVEDTARGLRQAMDSGVIGESYLLTGPVHTFQGAFDMAAKLAGRRPPPIHPPPALMRGAAGIAAVLENWDMRLPYAAETLRLMAGTSWIGSSAKAEAALGFSSRPLDEGLRHTIEHELRQLGMS